MHALCAPPTFVLSQDQTLRNVDVLSVHYSVVKVPPETDALASRAKNKSMCHTIRVSTELRVEYHQLTHLFLSTLNRSCHPACNVRYRPARAIAACTTHRRPGSIQMNAPTRGHTPSHERPSPSRYFFDSCTNPNSSEILQNLKDPQQWQGTFPASHTPGSKMKKTTKW